MFDLRSRRFDHDITKVFLVVSQIWRLSLNVEWELGILGEMSSFFQNTMNQGVILLFIITSFFIFSAIMLTRHDERRATRSSCDKPSILHAFRAIQVRLEHKTFSKQFSVPTSKLKSKVYGKNLYATEKFVK